MAGYGQPRKGADKRTKAVNSYFSPAELERLDRAQAVEMPDKPRGAYVRYAALRHVEGVDTSILELRAERWYYYSRDKYGREMCYAVNGETRLKMIGKLNAAPGDSKDWEVYPRFFKAGELTPAMAKKLKLNALAALLRAEAAEQ